MFDRKQDIILFIHNYLSEQRVNVPGYIEQIKTYVGSGKCVRGCLVLNTSPGAVKLAAAMELLHSGLLMHDDIMDRDETRRGLPSMHSAYRGLFMRDADHYGSSMAIGAGDLCYFYAFDLISQCTNSAELMCAITKELIHVGTAQMNEVYYSSSNYEPSKKEIMDVYRYKTARYTFSLPLMLGCIHTGENYAHYVQYGEDVGIAFQIRDDWLNLFGDSAVTGKPVGSDIRENKKTLYRLLCPAFNAQDVDATIEAMKQVDLTSEMQRLISSAKCIVDDPVLHDLADYCVGRMK